MSTLIAFCADQIERKIMELFSIFIRFTSQNLIHTECQKHRLSVVVAVMDPNNPRFSLCPFPSLPNRLLLLDCLRHYYLNILSFSHNDSFTLVHYFVLLFHSSIDFVVFFLVCTVAVRRPRKLECQTHNFRWNKRSHLTTHTDVFMYTTCHIMAWRCHAKFSSKFFQLRKKTKIQIRCCHCFSIRNRSNFLTHKHTTLHHNRERFTA